jgi:hypoxia up-regulated 1
MRVCALCLSIALLLSLLSHVALPTLPCQTFAERHFPVQPTYNESRHGASLAVGKDDFTPEELVAMVLNHAIEISVAHATENGKPIPPPKDVVLTVPTFSTGLERQALVDAASIIDLNVLTLMEENTAAALHYAMDKSFEEEDVVLVFFNLGAASLQVSVVRFFQYEQPQKFGKSKSTPALQVLGKAWDATLGGQAFDQVLVDILADEFNASWRKASGDATKDIRAFTRPMTKLRLQANKVKHVLSANSEIPINMDALHDDISLRTVITRSQFEEATAALLERSVLPFQKALAVANMTAADLTGVELIGGGMRVPAIQNRLQEALGDNLTVGLHMNADESMALGASFGGANISTAFRVRQVGLADISPWEETVTLTNLGEDTSSDEAWTKQATIFKSFGKLNVKKTIAFTHEQDVHCSLDYAESEWLPEGTQRELQRYQVSGVADFAKEMAEKGLEGKPKISLQFELDSSGITSLVKAEAALEETYMVEEEVEVDDEEDADAASSEEMKTEEKIEEKVEEAADSEKTEDGTEAEEPPKVEKKKKKVKVETVSLISCTAIHSHRFGN